MAFSTYCAALRFSRHNENEEAETWQTCQITGNVLPLYADSTGSAFPIDDSSVYAIDAYTDFVSVAEKQLA